jgi:hypothetical protein
VNGNNRDYQLRYSADLPTGPEIVSVRDVVVIPGRSDMDLDGVEPTKLATFPIYDLKRGREDAEPIDLTCCSPLS